MFARNNFSFEVDLSEERRSKEINGIPVIEAYYKGFLDPAVRKFIDKYYNYQLNKIIKMETNIRHVIILNGQD